MAGTRVALLTREFPPEVYGGAGVHVEYLARELSRLVELSVHCWGAERADPHVHAYRPWDALHSDTPHAAALEAGSGDLAMAGGGGGAQNGPRHPLDAHFARPPGKPVH